MTPRALRALALAGASPAKGPPLEILRAVNHRRFSASLGQTLPGARFVETLTELEETLAAPSPTGEWLAKRPFGFAGRGRYKLRGARTGAAAPSVKIAEDDPLRAWIDASLRSSDGLQIEPWVERLGDFALHGHVSRSGEVHLGEPTRQIVDASGAWRGSVRASPGDLADHERRTLFDHARSAGEALHRAGYFGPFGVDAFRWKDASGAARWNPRCEINARYSMGWAIGMDDYRPDLEDDHDDD